jgi:WD40 repeat protein
MTRRLLNLLNAAFLLLLAWLVVPLFGADAPTTAQSPLAKLRGPSGTAVEFSRDGKLLFTAGEDEVQVWDAETFQPLGQPIRHPGLAGARRADRVDVLLTVGDDARLWDARTCKPIGVPIEVPPVDPRDDEQSQDVAVWAIAAWPAAPWPAAVSPDGARVAVTHSDHQAAGPARWDVEVWDALARKQVASLRHDLRPAFLLFSPDGTRLLTAAPFDHRPHGGGEEFHLWDLATSREVRPPVRTKYNYAAPEYAPAAFSPDGVRLVIADKTTFTIHDAGTGKALAGSRPHQPDGRDGRSEGDLSSVAFSDDGRRIVSQNGGTFRVWDAATCTPVYTGTGHDAVLSADGSRVAAALSLNVDSHAVVVWDVATRRELVRFPFGEVWFHALEPDGRRLAVVADGVTQLWSVDPAD